MRQNASPLANREVWVACAVVWVVVCGVCVGWPAAAGVAAEPGAVGVAQPRPAPEVNPELVIPKRQIVYDESEEEMAVPVRSVESFGPRLAEFAQQRYVAVAKLRFRRPSRALTGRPDSYPRLLPRDERYVTEEPFQLPLDLALSVQRVPKDRLPPEELVTMLTTDAELHVRLSPLRYEEPVAVDPRKPPFDPSRFAVWPENGLSVRLMAPTKERAKELLEATLAIFDQGRCLAAYRNYVEVRDFHERLIPRYREQLKRVVAEESVRDKQRSALQGWSDITGQTLASLVAQRRMIAVDEAGIKARIAECDRLLTEGAKGPAGARPSQAKLDSLEVAKTMAQIELVGLEAKRRAIEELLEKGRKWIDLAESRPGRNSSWDLKSQMADIEARLAAYKEAVEKKRPFPEVDGKVLIRRVRWEQPKSRGPSPGPSGGTAPPRPRGRGPG